MDVMGVMAYEDVESPPLLLNSTYFHLRGPAAPFQIVILTRFQLILVVVKVRQTDFKGRTCSLFSLSIFLSTIISSLFISPSLLPRLTTDGDFERLMSSTNGTSPPELPNPQTPLAFFPPDLAYEVSVSIYTFVGSLAVSILLVYSLLQSCISSSQK